MTIHISLCTKKYILANSSLPPKEIYNYKYIFYIIYCQVKYFSPLNVKDVEIDKSFGQCFVVVLLFLKNKYEIYIQKAQTMA